MQPNFDRKLRVPNKRAKIQIYLRFFEREYLRAKAQRYNFFCNNLIINTKSSPFVMSSLSH